MFRRCVVFIDDDAGLLEVFSSILDDFDIEVHCFTNQKEALEKIEDICPGVVFIDYQMPDGDGLTLLGELIDILPKSKMIMLTGEGNEMIAVKAMKSGANDYLVKPVQPDQLVNVTHQYFAEYFSVILDLNGKYDYPLSDSAICRYEFLRAAYTDVAKSIKAVCNFFTYSRQDFYNYDRRFKAFGPTGLLKKKDFDKLPERYTQPKNSLKATAQVESFIDPSDDVQIKLEMLREAATVQKPNICDISKKYGFTREAFYQIYRRFQTEGMLALTEKKKGRPKQNA